MEEEKGKWEALIRSKIYDFNAETNPEDWDVLLIKLQGGKKVHLIPYRKYILAAVSTAAIIALMIVGGYYLFSDKTEPDTQAVVEIPVSQHEESTPTADDDILRPVESQVDHFATRVVAMVDVKTAPKQDTGEVTVLKPVTKEESDSAQDKEINNIVVPPKDALPDSFQKSATEKITVDQSHFAVVTTENKRRRWGFGVGGGGYALGTTTGGNAVSTASKMLSDEDFMQERNVVTLRGAEQGSTLFDPVEGFDNSINESDVGKIKHLKPLSLGMGISYYLTDRWALQSGVVYSLLRSKGSVNVAEGIADWKQNLHFIGVPLSATYKIANWKRVCFYVSAGGLAEWNVAGKKITTIVVNDLETVTNEKVRDKKALWSVNSRVGAVYPIWKIINLYAEGGVSYYFDNKSSIETIRLDKPFNVSLQAGIRLGF